LLADISYLRNMKVTKEGIYKDANGTEFPVFNVGAKVGMEYFRAYWRGGYYNVNEEPLNEPFDKVEWEMVEFVRDFKINEDGIKN
jgi:hypothetical protein